MHSYSSDDDRWRAVSTRDAAADGRFIYGVRTTRIYCRPNCKARLARRANVVYFADTGSAEAQGYRACKRCKPAVLGGMPDDAAVARIRSLVAASSPDGSVQKRSAARLATQARVSRWHFHRTFKQVTGLTPRAYLQKREAEAAHAPTQAGPQEGTVEHTADPREMESPSALTALPLDDMTDWFDFDSLLGLAPGPDGSILDETVDVGITLGETADVGNNIASEEYLDGIDPCLLHSC